MTTKLHPRGKCWRASPILTLRSSKFGAEIIEIAMDSTWKTNAAGYELYGIVGEAKGRALPLAFAFTASVSAKAKPGAKDRMLQPVIRRVKKDCPKIRFAHSDKDKTEIKAVQDVLPDAKTQLCYWHAIKYEIFEFIDPTWAPGVTSGWLEDGVHEDDGEVPKPNSNSKEISEDAPEVPATQPPLSTCRPPVLVIIAPDGKRIPAWPDPPKITKSKLTTFCPKEHRDPIILMPRKFIKAL